MPPSSKKSLTPRFSKPLVAAIILVAAAGSIFLAKYVLWGRVGAQDSIAARAAGDPKAAVHIVEYLDFQCPACAYGAKQIHNYLETFPGKIYLEVKYFPLGGHVHSMGATKYAQCSARQGKFWPYLSTVFERQAQWKGLFDAQPAFVQIIKDIGADANKIQSCVANDDIRKEIMAEKDAGVALGIQSTPTYFINGKMFVGVKPMMEEVERLLGAVPTQQNVK